MELILARAFLKEADLVSTSTKRGAVIRGDILMEQIPELISQSVLPATHAIHYLPKERKKGTSSPSHSSPLLSSPPPLVTSSLPTLSILNLPSRVDWGRHAVQLILAHAKGSLSFIVSSSPQSREWTKTTTRVLTSCTRTSMYSFALSPLSLSSHSPF